MVIMFQLELPEAVDDLVEGVKDENSNTRQKHLCSQIRKERVKEEEKSGGEMPRQKNRIPWHGKKKARWQKSIGISRKFFLLLLRAYPCWPRWNISWHIAPHLPRSSVMMLAAMGWVKKSLKVAVHWTRTKQQPKILFLSHLEGKYFP